MVNEEIDAGAELVRRFAKFQPVKVAFWLKPSEKEKCYLYIASDEIDDSNYDIAYGETVRLVNEVSSPFID